MDNNIPKKLETNRLIISFIDFTDVDSIFHCYAQNINIAKFLAWIPHKSKEETKEFVNERINENKFRFTWTIKQKETKQLIGMISLKFLTFYRISFSYLIVQNEWKKGYATEAASKLRDWALDNSNIYRIEAYCDINNIGSSKVLKKIGMEKKQY